MNCHPRIPTITAAAFAVLVMAGCDHHTADAEWPESSTESSDADIDALTDVPQSEVASAIERGEIEALLQAWIEAQNRLDFEAYAELYSPSFTGVPNADADEQPDILDRDTWLESQRRAFLRSMAVDLKDVDIDADSETSHISFFQSTATTDTRREGPKEMVLTRDDGGLRIEDEIAFETTTAPIDDNVEPVSAQELAQVVTAGYGDNKATYMVLEPDVSPDWFDDNVEYQGYEAARSPVIEERIPGDLSSWQGRPVQIFDTDGNRCDATVAGLYGLTRVVPHFGQVNDWRGNPRVENDASLSGEPAAPEVIADAIWQMGPSPHLVAKLEHTGDDECRDETPIWARTTDRDSRPLQRVELSDDERQALLDAFRNLDDYQTIQDDYLEWVDPDDVGDSQGTWSTSRGSGPEIDAFRSDETGRTFALVWANVGHGCGGFWGSVAELFELRTDDDTLRVVNWGGFDDPLRPLAMVDVDGSDAPHVVAESYFPQNKEYLLRPHGGAHRIAQTLVTPIHDCLC